MHHDIKEKLDRPIGDRSLLPSTDFPSVHCGTDVTALKDEINKFFSDGLKMVVRKHTGRVVVFGCNKNIAHENKCPYQMKYYKHPDGFIKLIEYPRLDHFHVDGPPPTRRTRKSKRDGGSLCQTYAQRASSRFILPDVSQMQLIPANMKSQSTITTTSGTSSQVASSTQRPQPTPMQSTPIVNLAYNALNAQDVLSKRPRSKDISSNTEMRKKLTIDDIGHDPSSRDFFEGRETEVAGTGQDRAVGYFDSKSTASKNAQIINPPSSFGGQSYAGNPPTYTSMGQAKPSSTGTERKGFFDPLPSSASLPPLYQTNLTSMTLPASASCTIDSIHQQHQQQPPSASSAAWVQQEQQQPQIRTFYVVGGGGQSLADVHHHQHQGTGNAGMPLGPEGAYYYYNPTNPGLSLQYAPNPSLQTQTQTQTQTHIYGPTVLPENMYRAEQASQGLAGSGSGSGSGPGPVYQFVAGGGAATDIQGLPQQQQQQQHQQQQQPPPHPQHQFYAFTAGQPTYAPYPSYSLAQNMQPQPQPQPPYGSAANEAPLPLQASMGMAYSQGGGQDVYYYQPAANAIVNSAESAPMPPTWLRISAGGGGVDAQVATGQGSGSGPGSEVQGQGQGQPLLYSYYPPQYQQQQHQYEQQPHPPPHPLPPPPSVQYYSTYTTASAGIGATAVPATMYANADAAGIAQIPNYQYQQQYLQQQQQQHQPQSQRVSMAASTTSTL